MSVCRYVLTYVRTYVCICMYMYVCLHVYVCICIYVYVCMYVCMYVYMNAYICIGICIYTHVYVYASVCIYMYILQGLDVTSVTASAEPPPLDTFPESVDDDGYDSSTSVEAQHQQMQPS